MKNKTETARHKLPRYSRFDAYAADLLHAMDVLCYRRREAEEIASALLAGYEPGRAVTLYSGRRAMISH